MAPRAYAFLLVPGHSQLGLACAVEALSLANLFPDGPYYRWRLMSETGGPVPAYNGVAVGTEPLAPLDPGEALVVCAGANASRGTTRSLLGWISEAARQERDVGALSSGSYLLARAGILSGKTVTTHWEYRSALLELLPDVTIEDTLFSVDARIFTCAGGAASMDMMLDRVRTDYGAELAQWVADQMVYTTPRAARSSQRMAPTLRPAARNAKLRLALQIMENNIEDPLRPDEIAALVGLSTRQLERLFASYLGDSPKRRYLGLRLDHARQLLRQTDMTVTEVSIATGFRTLSHFSKSYRKRFGTLPMRDAADPAQFW